MEELVNKLFDTIVLEEDVTREVIHKLIDKLQRTMSNSVIFNKGEIVTMGYSFKGDNTSWVGELAEDYDTFLMSYSMPAYMSKLLYLSGCITGTYEEFPNAEDIGCCDAQEWVRIPTAEEKRMFLDAMERNSK